MDFLIGVFMFASLILAGFIGGSTAYISLIEVPARNAMAGSVGPSSWREMFPRAAKLMKSISPVMIGLFVVSFLFTFNWLWLVACAPAIGLGLYTVKQMAPVNEQLLDDSLDLSSTKAKELTAEWGKRHFNRTLMGGALFVLATLAALTS